MKKSVRSGPEKCISDVMAPKRREPAQSCRVSPLSLTTHQRECHGGTSGFPSEGGDWLARSAAGTRSRKPLTLGSRGAWCCPSQSAEAHWKGDTAHEEADEANCPGDGGGTSGCGAQGL